MRALVLVLDIAGVGILVTAAWITWGPGAGLAAVGAGCVFGAMYADVTAARRRKEQQR